MKSNPVFWRKVTYLALGALIMVPMSWLSRPSMRDREGNLQEGGVLAQLRHRYNLTPADLGEIDPASETMKLATLGLRGVAANLLWEQAIRYQREFDWDNLTATLNQLSKLQPNFISVWQFQGWNLAYNVSVEFDDYRSRYHWVTKGIDFLFDGIRYNREEPVLRWEIGWMFGHKIGRADEYVQYRRLFRQDEDFHDRISRYVNIDDARGPDGRPDNWLVGREWFLVAQKMVDSGIPIRGRLLGEDDRLKRGKNPLIFHSYPPLWLIKHAEIIEEEGYLDEKGQYAWMRAGRDWHEYGNREIPTSYDFAIRLNDLEQGFLFGVPLEYETQLDSGQIPDALKQEFERRRLALSESAQLSARETGHQWQIVDNNKKYTLVKDSLVNDADTLNIYEEAKAERESRALAQNLDALLPGVRERLVQQKRAALSDQERAALETPEEQRTDEQVDLALQAAPKIEVTYEEVAQQAPSSLRAEVLRLARRATAAEAYARAVRSYQDQVNYPYWKLRCQIEQTNTAIQARKHLYDAQKAYEETNLEGMRRHFEEAWDRWAKIFDEYPEMMEDTTAEDLIEQIHRYRWVLEQLNQPWPPPDFKLGELVALYERTGASQPE